MAKSINRTPAQAAIARRIAIRNRQAARMAGINGTQEAITTAPANKMLGNCIAAAGFAEHAAYYA